MKKAICAIMMVLLCGFIFTACNTNDETLPTDYVSKSGRCVISLPKGYEIVYENNDEHRSATLDENLINADTINGKPKKDGYAYYSILCGTPFRILTPLGVIEDKNANNQTLVYWKLNDTLYKDSDAPYSENTFTCAQDTEITPLYYEFRTVGMILLEADENGAPIVSENEIFDDNGCVQTQDGVHYFYGIYDFEPQKEVWKSNLILDGFNISYTTKPAAINFSKRIYTIDIKIKKSSVFRESSTIIVDELCKIDGHGYMLGKGAAHAINQIEGDVAINATYNFTIGEHRITYSFVD